jgi:hypothetical protein
MIFTRRSRELPTATSKIMIVTERYTDESASRVIN